LSEIPRVNSFSRLVFVIIIGSAMGKKMGNSGGDNYQNS